MDRRATLILVDFEHGRGRDLTVRFTDAVFLVLEYFRYQCDSKAFIRLWRNIVSVSKQDVCRDTVLLSKILQAVLPKMTISHLLRDTTNLSKVHET